MVIRIMTWVLSIPLAGLLMLAIEFFCLGEKSQALNVIIDAGALLKDSINAKLTLARLSHYLMTGIIA